MENTWKNVKEECLSTEDGPSQGSSFLPIALPRGGHAVDRGPTHDRRHDPYPRAKESSKEGEE